MKKSLLIIIILIIALFVSLTLVFRTTIFTNRATNYTDNSPVLSNSYLFASPLQANTKNNEKIRITVFVLDNQGLGVANQSVTLTSQQNLTVENIQSTTSDTGQASFDISSATPGKYPISAKVGTNQIPQSISVTFY